MSQIGTKFYRFIWTQTKNQPNRFIRLWKEQLKNAQEWLIDTRLIRQKETESILKDQS